MRLGELSSGFTDRNETSSLKNPSSQYNLAFVKQGTDMTEEMKSNTPRGTDDGTVKYNLSEKSSPPKFARGIAQSEP